MEPNSLLVIKLCQKWRADGLEIYFTLNTGQDIHLIVEQKNVEKLVKRLKKLEEVRNIIINTPGTGTRLTSSHLF